MLQQIKRTGSRCLLLVPLGLIVLLFECVPLVSMFVKAFSENGRFSLAQFGTIATSWCTSRPSSTACG